MVMLRDASQRWEQEFTRLKARLTGKQRRIQRIQAALATRMTAEKDEIHHNSALYENMAVNPSVIQSNNQCAPR